MLGHSHSRMKHHVMFERVLSKASADPLYIRGIQEPKSTRIPLRCRSSNLIMRKDSTTSGSRRSKNPAICNFDQMQERQAVDFTLVCHLDKTPETKVQDAQTSQHLRYLLRPDPEGVQQEYHPREGQDRKLFRIREAVIHKRTVVNSPCKKHKSVSRARVVGTDDMLEDTLCALIEKVSQQSWQLTLNQESLLLRKSGNFQEDQKTSSRVPCPCCNKECFTGTTFCACDAKQQLLANEREVQAQASTQAGFAYILALTQLETRTRHVQRNIHDQSRARQQHGKSPGH